jgi:hypothetical protein
LETNMIFILIMPLFAKRQGEMNASSIRMGRPGQPLPGPAGVSI